MTAIMVQTMSALDLAAAMNVQKITPVLIVRQIAPAMKVPQILAQ
jgi:hypothetical protein